MEALTKLAVAFGSGLFLIVIALIGLLFASNVGFLMAAKSLDMFTDAEKYNNGSNASGVTPLFAKAYNNTNNQADNIETIMQVVSTVLGLVGLIIIVFVVFGKGGVLSQIKAMGGAGGRGGYN